MKIYPIENHGAANRAIVSMLIYLFQCAFLVVVAELKEALVKDPNAKIFYMIRIRQTQMNDMKPKQRMVHGTMAKCRTFFCVGNFFSLFVCVFFFVPFNYERTWHSKMAIVQKKSTIRRKDTEHRKCRLFEIQSD